MLPSITYLLEAFLLIYLTMVIAQFSFALAAKVAKVPVEQISLGMGWTMLRIGVVHLKIIPFSGYVKMKSSLSETLTEEEVSHGFDLLPAWEKIFIFISAILVLFLLGLAIHGADAVQWFLSTFPQYYMGALGPLSTAQELIAIFEHDLRTNSFLYCLGLVSVKQAALIPLFSWGSYINMFTKETEQISAFTWFISTILVMASWLVALGYYLWQQLSF